MTALPARFDAHLAGLGLPAGRALAAVSGGPDSVALLHLLAGSAAARAFELAVVHVDHGMHPESGRPAALVRSLGARLGLRVITERLALGPGASETRARQARYQVFRRVLRREQAALLFLAHHADDQIETVLMRFLRGSGAAGLAGMPARAGRLVRPLLPFGREELARYLRELGVEVWDDPANRDPRHDRSWLRHQVIPLLRARWPGFREAQLAAARIHAADREAWGEVTEALGELDFRRESGGVSVAAVPLRGYSSALQRALLRALARRAGLGIGGRHLDQVQALMAQGHSGRRADLGQGGVAEIAFGRLRLFRPVAHLLEEQAVLAGVEGTARVGAWTLRWRPGAAPAALDREGPGTWVPSVQGLVARSWRRGDRIRPLGGRGSRPVVRCMQERKIPRSERAGWPVLLRDSVVVWVPGVCRADSQVPAAGAPAVRIDACRD